MTSNTVSISIDFGDGSTPKQVTGVPWYPGITVLQAMTIGQAMNPGSFSFRLLYHSFFGAFVDMIDDVADAGDNYWLFSVSNQPSPVGISEAIISEDSSGQNIDVEWLYGPAEKHASKDQALRKIKAYKRR